MSEEQARLQRELKKTKALLAKLEEQSAGFGSLHVPAHILVEIDDARVKIAELEKRLSESPPDTVSERPPRRPRPLGGFERNIRAATKVLDEYNRALLWESDPRKRMQYEQGIRETQAQLNKLLQEYTEAGGDPEKFGLKLL